MASLTLSFTQGFLLGQLSVVILIGAFIKFFIFGEPPSSDSSASARLSTRRPHSAVLHKRSLSTSSPKKTPQRRATPLRPSSSAGGAQSSSGPDLATSTILAKTYYNVHSHQPESLDWFNVLVAQTIAQFRADALADDAILSSLTSALNGNYKPAYMGDIRVTEISLGEEFPIFSNCRVWPLDDESGGVLDDDSRLQARMDVDLSDFITLGVETMLILNYPQPRTAVLPVALAVSVVRFSGTVGLPDPPPTPPSLADPFRQLSISFLPCTPPSTPSISTSPRAPPHPPTTLAFSFLPDYRLDLSVRSLVGSRSRLQDVPKIAQLVEARLHAWFDERAVTPRFQQIALPSLWPRKQTTRGGEEDGEVGVGIRVGSPGGQEERRDVVEEARREVEAERRAAERREREGERWEEGVRWRGRAGEGWEGSGLPGSMPGMLVS
ncbi:MAG: ERMES complex subunit mmm1 [Vezdaea aestivalis]|nr:MAG: ERMES complex subunit mmm1 [Vezdaea aestivalis]